MTAISTNGGLRRRWLSSIAGAIRRRMAQAMGRGRLRAETKALVRLPRHLFRDIGLEELATQNNPGRC